MSVDHPDRHAPSFVVDLRFVRERRRYGLDVGLATRLLLVGAGNLERPLREAAVECSGVLRRRLRRRQRYVRRLRGRFQHQRRRCSKQRTSCASLGTHRGRVTCLAAHPASRKQRLLRVIRLA